MNLHFLFEIHLNNNRLISICVSDLSIEICRLYLETSDFCTSDMHDYFAYTLLFLSCTLHCLDSKENSLLRSHNNSLEEN